MSDVYTTGWASEASYIGAGTAALKRGRTLRVRIAALVVALATFGYIVSVAITKSALGFLSGL